MKFWLLSHHNFTRGRSHVPFVTAAVDRDIDELVRRTADTALSVRDALLALEE